MDGSGRRRWKVRHHNRFLHKVMTHLAGNALISFEGDLSSCAFEDHPNASMNETAVLRRNTLSPPQNFITIPLEPDNVRNIFQRMGGTLPSGVLHVAIEKDGKLAFAAYDRFHSECIVFGPAFPEALMKSLTDERLLERLP